MTRAAAFITLLTLLIAHSTARASLNPGEVVVVVNNNPQVAATSRAVAEYYCAQRGIPAANIAEVTAPAGEVVGPDYYVSAILADTENPPSLVHLLKSRPGFDINDPGTDPTKALVMCYGIPLKLFGAEVRAAVDSSLTLLFNTTPWGARPVRRYSDYSNVIHNRFAGAIDTGRFDFGDFRRSGANAVLERAPVFHRVRMLSPDKALAGGGGGMLFRGERSGGAWTWAAVPDEHKQFIRGGVTDICVLDGSTAVMGTAGAVLRTTDSGATWTAASWGDGPISISFYSSQNGWAVGWIGDAPAILRYADGQRTSVSLPVSGFEPSAIAATDANRVWVTGNSGIWLSTDTGASWTAQDTSGAAHDIWVGKDGDAYVGWAVTGDGAILALDSAGSTWSSVSGVTVANPAAADIATYDAHHITIADGSGAYLVYDGNSWMVDSSGSFNKGSVAWAGGDSSVAVTGSDSVVRLGTQSQGGCTWTAAVSVPDHTWKMRYLVCRLDGYSYPVDTATGIPVDIKNMIDSSVRATNAGRSAFENAKVLLDGPHGKGANYTAHRVSALRDVHGASNVLEDESASIYLDQNQTISGDVIGYSSTGSYHPGVHDLTRWYRPLNISWADGAVGLYKAVSGDALTLRDPRLIWTLDPDTVNVQAGKLKVYLWAIVNDPNGLYSTHWIRLRSSAGDLLASAQFTETETIEGLNVRTATIDLGAVQWPGDQKSYVAVCFPDDDPLHAGEAMSRWPQGATTDIWAGSTAGVTFRANVNQSLGTELIRLGCAATAGNVTEPTAYACPQPETIFQLYTGGCTWAESAYGGFPAIAWMEVAVGDPLMCPFKIYPSVGFEAPSPAEDAHVSGPVTLEASATPEPPGTIQKVQFWVSNGQQRTMIAEDWDPPYGCAWDALASSGGNRVYPDGGYTIEAIAYEAGLAYGEGTTSRSVTLDSTLPAVSITDPPADDAVLRTPVTVSAQVSGGTPSRVEFWLLGDAGPVLAGEDTSAPYECLITSALVPEGVYGLQAIAYGDSTPYTSYSARRRMLLVSDSPVFASIGDLASAEDGTDLFVASLPVVAGTGDVMGSAFYIEDPSRAAGIRVETSGAVALGRKVTVRGVLHTQGVGLTERYIAASRVWDLGPTDVPEPVTLVTRGLGGQPPAGNPGVTGAVGAYNVGLLTTVIGKVTLAGASFLYLDDGSAILDGSGVLRPALVYEDGQERSPSCEPVRGVRVEGAGDITTVDDFLCVTGVSSTTQAGEQIARCLRARSGQDALSPAGYPRYPRVGKGESGLFWIPNGPSIPVGGRVALHRASVTLNAGQYLTVDHQEGSLDTTTTRVVAATSRQYGDCITVLGTVGAAVDETGDTVIADKIYLEDVTCGQGMSAGLPQSMAVTGEEKWAAPEPGSIDYALAQADGTSVTLSLVQVVKPVDGSFGVKELSEILGDEPRLVVASAAPTLPSWLVDVSGTITSQWPAPRLITGAEVWLYTDAAGRAIPPYSQVVTPDWPWKRQIQ